MCWIKVGFPLPFFPLSFLSSFLPSFLPSFLLFHLSPFTSFPSIFPLLPSFLFINHIFHSYFTVSLLLLTYLVLLYIYFFSIIVCKLPFDTNTLLFFPLIFPPLSSLIPFQPYYPYLHIPLLFCILPPSFHSYQHPKNRDT